MKALYTETFKEFLENNASNPELLALIYKIENNFPGFIFNLIDENETTISFFNILKSKFEFREIGYETEDLFFASLNRKTDEVIIKYKEKVEMVINKFPALLSHKMDMNEVENYYEYMNPSVASTANLNVNSAFKRERDHQRIIGIATDEVDLLVKFQEIKSIYYEAVEKFEPCFMGCF